MPVGSITSNGGNTGVGVNGMSDEHYQVFLSHAGCDKPFVRQVAERLRQDGISFFLDEAILVPGTPWQVALEQALRASDSCAVFIGDEGLGPYHTLEMRVALSEQAEANRGFRVIPVLLPGQTRPNKRDLPSFLKQLTWVDFTTDPDQYDTAYRRLKAGIEGKEPGFGPPASEPTPVPVRSIASNGIHSGGKVADEDAVRPRHPVHWIMLASPTRWSGARWLTVTVLGVLLAMILLGWSWDRKGRAAEGAVCAP